MKLVHTLGPKSHWVLTDDAGETLLDTGSSLLVLRKLKQLSLDIPTVVQTTACFDSEYIVSWRAKVCNTARIKQHNKVITTWHVGRAKEIGQRIRNDADARTKKHPMEAGYYELEIVTPTDKIIDSETMIA